MNETLGLNIVLFKIKDPDFDLTAYGLTGRYFRLDVTKNINSSKSVRFTEYPLIDGTTRIDTITRAPGILNFQGEIGELFSFSNKDYSVESSGEKSRIELSIELLETLRDEAIVLDVLTEGKTFNNYLIESVNFTFEKFGMSTVNFTLKEFIAFNNELDEIIEDTSTSPTLYNPDELEGVTVKNFETDEEMVREIYSTITSSAASPTFSIRFGSSAINPDKFITPIAVNNIPTMDRVKGGLRINPFFLFVAREYTYTYTPTIVKKQLPMQIITSGLTKKNFFIKITIPQINTGSFTKEEAFVFEDVILPPTLPINETPKYEIKIELNQRIAGEDRFITESNIKTEDAMVSARFSNVNKGINPLTGSNIVSSNFTGATQLENDPIVDYGNIPGHIFSVNFLRKTTNFLGLTEYKAVPNLLNDNDLGYLYPAFYYSKRSVPKREIQYSLNISFIYLNAEFAYKIKEKIIENAKNSNNLLNRKKITWW